MMHFYRVTFVHYDKDQSFTYEVEARTPWEAFLKQPENPNLKGPAGYKTWIVEDVGIEEEK